MPVEMIVAMILAVDIIHIDETSIRVNGKMAWVWIFLNPETGDCLFRINDSRGSDVLNEVLGDKKWNGIIVCDGWSPYRKYKIQRCWAHILREMRTLHERNPASQAAADAYAALCRIFDYARDTIDIEGTSWRRGVHSSLLRRTSYLVRKYQKDPVIGEFMEKLDRARKDLFRFVLDPRISPTNNAAERGLREIVVHRKIRGGIRSEDTKIWMANLFSCVTTWKNQKLDYIQKLMEYM